MEWEEERRDRWSGRKRGGIDEVGGREGWREETRDGWKPGYTMGTHMRVSHI